MPQSLCLKEKRTNSILNSTYNRLSCALPAYAGACRESWLSYALPALAGVCRESWLSYALPAYAGAYWEHHFLRDTVLGILLTASNLPDDRIRHPWLKRSWRTSVSATVKAARRILRTVITRKKGSDMPLQAQGALQPERRVPTCLCKRRERCN